MENKRKNSGMHLTLNILCTGILLCSGSYLLVSWSRKSAQEQLVQDVWAVARETELEAGSVPEPEVRDSQPEPEEDAGGAYEPPVDFTALQEINPDVIGWISVPGTAIDYPVVWKEDDNEYYLHKDLKGNDSVYGTIYLDSSSKPDFSGKNHVVYGHHMKDGSMFRDVVKFKDLEFFKTNRYLAIYTPERKIRLKTLACYYGPADGIIRKTDFNGEEDFSSWLNERLSGCSFAEYPDVQIGSVYTLVTCSYEIPNARTYLFAAEVDGNGEFIP